jgi:hypothetical protein
MAATVHKLFTATDVPPGATYHFTWNNIPSGKAYAVDAQPFHLVSSTGPSGTTQAEVTRFWRRTRIIQLTGHDVEAHNDVLFNVKNVGNIECHFHLYLTVFS